MLYHLLRLQMSIVQCPAWLRLIWRRLSSAAFCRLADLCRRVDLQQLWGLVFHSCLL